MNVAKRTSSARGYVLQLAMMAFLLAALEIAHSYWASHRYVLFTLSAIFSVSVVICMGFFCRRIITVTLVRPPEVAPEAAVTHHEKEL